MALIATLQGFGETGKSQIPLADPYILLDNGKYYAYGTHSADGIEVYTSDDMRSWNYSGLALNKMNTTETQNFWAPEVYHVHGKYYMYYSANEHLYAAVGDTPTGPFKQIGSYQMSDLLGDEKCIDSSVFFDDDGTAYLFFVRFTDGNCIWMCKLDSDYVTPVKGTLKLCINVSQDWEKKMGRVCEGPNVIKHNGYYYLTYSANDYQSQDYGVGFARVKSLAATAWTKNASNPILQRVDGLVGTGHHSLFYDKDGKLRIVFHAHNSASVIHPRLMYIGTMEWTGNGGYRLSFSDEPLIVPIRVSATSVNLIQQTSGFDVYNINGRQLPGYAKGINIVRDHHGKVKKVMVKAS